MLSVDMTPKILVIDDEEIIRQGIKRLLTKQQYDVYLAENGEAGLAILKKEPIHIVLLDLKMPGMDGMEVLQSIMKAHMDVTVIVVTGHGTLEEAVSAMKMGAYDFISKPFLPDHLKQVVGRAVELRRLEQERNLLAEERERGLWTIVTEKSRLKTVINSMSEGVLIAELDKTIIMCNPAFTRFMHAGHQCIIGSTMDDNPELNPLTEMADRLLASKDDTQVITQEITIEGEPPSYLRASINSILDNRGQALGLVAVLKDVSHFKELERKKSEFISMVTHELRAPLGAVDTQIAVILRSIAGSLSETHQSMFERMRARIKGLLDLINDLLGLSTIESQKFVQEKKAMDISPVLREVCSLMEDQAREKGLTLTTSLQNGLPPILADPASIQKVATNLLSNAIRYTPEGGKITVGSWVESNYVNISVADTGIGITPEDIDKIFDRFYRVKNEKTRKIVGTGLGLPIVKAIVEDHLGHVIVKSELDKGSEFTVQLPIIM